MFQGGKVSRNKVSLQRSVVCKRLDVLQMEEKYLKPKKLKTISCKLITDR